MVYGNKGVGSSATRLCFPYHKKLLKHHRPTEFHLGRSFVPSDKSSTLILGGSSWKMKMSSYLLTKSPPTTPTPVRTSFTTISTGQRLCPEVPHIFLIPGSLWDPSQGRHSKGCCGHGRKCAGCKEMWCHNQEMNAATPSPAAMDWELWNKLASRK